MLYLLCKTLKYDSALFVKPCFTLVEESDINKSDVMKMLISLYEEITNDQNALKTQLIMYHSWPLQIFWLSFWQFILTPVTVEHLDVVITIYFKSLKAFVLLPYLVWKFTLERSNMHTLTSTIYQWFCRERNFKNFNFMSWHTNIKFT